MGSGIHRWTNGLLHPRLFFLVSPEAAAVAGSRLSVCLRSSKQYREIYLFGGIPALWKCQEPMCMMKKSLWSILSTPLDVYFPQMRRVFHRARELRMQDFQRPVASFSFGSLPKFRHRDSSL
uniref:Uncharacterized protein n=1 Tax=Oryza punctata TaxID=4537 RepID=A0A0E0JF68_ORYPU